MNRCDECGRFAADEQVEMVEHNYLTIDGDLEQEWSIIHKGGCPTVTKPNSKKYTLTCQMDGCDHPYDARGLCGTHYKAWWWANQTDEARTERRKQRAAQAKARWAALPEDERRRRKAHYNALAKARHPNPNGNGAKRSVKQSLVLDLLANRGQWTSIITLWGMVQEHHSYAQLVAVRRMVHRMVKEGKLRKRRVRNGPATNMIEVRPV